MLFERVGHTRRRLRQLALVATDVLRFDLLNATLEFAHILEILVHATTIGGAKVALERRHLAHDPIENAAVVLATGRTVGVARAGAEQQVERCARIPDHGQRLSGRGPADRVGVGAGVVVVAAASLIEILDAQLHRGDRRVLSDLARHDLVERGADIQIGTLRLLGVRLCEKHRARSEVITADLRRIERFGHAHVGVADDRHFVLPRFHRRKRAFRVEREIATDTLRRPQILRRAPAVRTGRAVYRFDGHQALVAGERCTSTTNLGQETASRLHRIKIRKCYDGTHVPEEGAARKGFLRHERHGSISVGNRISCETHQPRPARRACYGRLCCSPHPSRTTKTCIGCARRRV